jgi:hypothetical protein
MYSTAPTARSSEGIKLQHWQALSDAWIGCDMMQLSAIGIFPTVGAAKLERLTPGNAASGTRGDI